MFKSGKLDYPNAQTDKASKKFLKGMKNLEVRRDLLSFSSSSTSLTFSFLSFFFSLQQIIPPTNVIQSRFCNLIKQLLHFDPARRLDVKGALEHEFFSLQM